MTVAFDTLKAVQRLSAAGFSEKQAASLAATFAEGINENLATKDDLELVRMDIEKDIELVRKDIKALDTKIDTPIEGLRKDMTVLKKDMTINLSGIVVAGITVLKVTEKFLAN